MYHYLKQIQKWNLKWPGLEFDYNSNKSVTYWSTSIKKKTQILGYLSNVFNKELASRYILKHPKPKTFLTESVPLQLCIFALLELQKGRLELNNILIKKTS